MRYTASVLAIVDSHDAGTTVQLRGSKDAAPNRDVWGSQPLQSLANRLQLDVVREYLLDEL